MKRVLAKDGGVERVLKRVEKQDFEQAGVPFQQAASEIETLIKKIKDNVMRNRIRLGEFLQDHDPLRKGRIEATKFRTTLYAQKI